MFTCELEAEPPPQLMSPIRSRKRTASKKLFLLFLVLEDINTIAGISSPQGNAVHAVALCAAEAGCGALVVTVKVEIAGELPVS